MALLVANGCGTVGNVVALSIAPLQHGMVGEPDHKTFGEHAIYRNLGGLAGLGILDVKDVEDELRYEYAEETAGVDKYAQVYGGNSADVEAQRKLALAMIDYAATEVLVHGVECPIQLAGSGSDRLSQLTNNRVRGLLE